MIARTYTDHKSVQSQPDVISSKLYTYTAGSCDGLMLVTLEADCISIALAMSAKWGQAIELPRVALHHKHLLDCILMYLFCISFRVCQHLILYLR